MFIIYITMAITVYQKKLLDPRWQKKRLKIFERDDWACQICKDNTNTLHVHHKKYKSNPWDSPDEDLFTLCKSCHLIIEKIKDSFYPEKVVVRKECSVYKSYFLLGSYKGSTEKTIIWRVVQNNEFIFPFGAISLDDKDFVDYYFN